MEGEGEGEKEEEEEGERERARERARARARERDREKEKEEEEEEESNALQKFAKMCKNSEPQIDHTKGRVLHSAATAVLRNRSEEHMYIPTPSHFNPSTISQYILVFILYLPYL